MNRLASIGIAFQDDYIDKIFEQNVQYYEDPPKVPKTLSNIFSRAPDKQWAIASIYDKHRPVRPWALGKIWNSETGLYRITGTKWRTPGLNTRADVTTLPSLYSFSSLSFHTCQVWTLEQVPSLPRHILFMSLDYVSQHIFFRGHPSS